MMVKSGDMFSDPPQYYYIQAQASATSWMVLTGSSYAAFIDGTPGTYEFRAANESEQATDITGHKWAVINGQWMRQD
jgi:hypothetical protein